MKRKYLYAAVAAVILICIGAAVFFLRPDQGEKLVKDFLNETLTKSEEQAGLYQALLDSPALIGEGVDAQMAEASAEQSRQAEEKWKEVYGVYLNDQGMDDFSKAMLGYMMDLYQQDETWEVTETTVTRDNDAYKFHVNMTVGENRQEIEGRAEVTDGKISSLDLTEL